MKNKLRKKCHKKMVKLLQRINHNLEVDEWFNGRYYLRMCSEDWFQSDETMCWLLALKDKYNPLHTFLFRTDMVYCTSYEEHCKYIQDMKDKDNFVYESYQCCNLDFTYTKIWHAMNSWMQFCDDGYVSDSPSHCNMSWPYNEKIRTAEITKEPNILPKSKYSKVQEIFGNMNTYWSFVYRDGDRVFPIDLYDQKNRMKVAGFDKVYRPSGLSWSYKNSACIMNDNNELEAMVIKVGKEWFIVMFEIIPAYKHWTDHQPPAVTAYKLPSIDMFDKDKSFQCWYTLVG